MCSSRMFTFSIRILLVFSSLHTYMYGIYASHQSNAAQYFLSFSSYNTRCYRESSQETHDKAHFFFGFVSFRAKTKSKANIEFVRSKWNWIRLSSNGHLFFVYIKLLNKYPIDNSFSGMGDNLCLWCSQ